MTPFYLYSTLSIKINIKYFLKIDIISVQVSAQLLVSQNTNPYKDYTKVGLVPKGVLG